jgi:LysM repeat protein
MKNLDLIAEELFNKIRGRFPSITIGDEEGKVTDQPPLARFFDFQYKQGGDSLGSVSVTLTDDAVQVMYNTDVVANETGQTRTAWYNFLKELRMFAKKRLLKFDTRNIQKSNLDKRDYKFLAKQRTGDEQMTEAKLYGTSRKSYQDIGTARVTIEHHKPVNHDLAAGRTMHINRLYVESSEGERFKYPFKHLNGARAMARHVSEGGAPYDDFGKHITGLSEELASLRKFKTYMSRSAVMAEGLSDYTSVVIERIDAIKKTVEQLQRQSHYNEAIDTFETAILEDVPSDVSENWIDQLTIRQFNEELKDVFPYIYKLISEKTVAEKVSAEDLVSEAPVDDVEVRAPAETYKVSPGDTLYSIAEKFQDANFQGSDIKEAVKEIMMLNNISDPKALQVGQVLEMPYFMGSGPDGSSRGLPGKFDKYGEEIDMQFDELMGQFGEGKKNCGCGQDPCITYGQQEEGMSQFNKYQDHKDLIDDLESGLKDSRRGNDMADFIADELGDYIRAGIEDMGEEKWQDSLAGQALAELDNAHLEGPEAQAKAFQDALNVLKQNESMTAMEAEEYHCKDCNDTMHKPTTNCRHDSHDEQGRHWVDQNGNGIHDADEGQEMPEEQKTPVTEFVLSMYDRETGQFPKGETAVLTAIEKDYGENFIEPAKKFIEAINAKFEEFNGYKDPELMDNVGDTEYGRAPVDAQGNPDTDQIKMNMIKVFGVIKDNPKKLMKYLQNPKVLKYLRSLPKDDPFAQAVGQKMNDIRGVGKYEPTKEAELKDTSEVDRIKQLSGI